MINKTRANSNLGKSRNNLFKFVSLFLKIVEINVIIDELSNITSIPGLPNKIVMKIDCQGFSCFA